jgi:hypothetical protein
MILFKRLKAQKLYSDAKMKKGESAGCCAPPPYTRDVSTHRCVLGYGIAIEDR